MRAEVVDGGRGDGRGGVAGRVRRVVILPIMAWRPDASERRAYAPQDAVDDGTGGQSA